MCQKFRCCFSFDNFSGNAQNKSEKKFLTIHLTPDSLFMLNEKQGRAFSALELTKLEKNQLYTLSVAVNDFFTGLKIFHLFSFRHYFSNVFNMPNFDDAKLK